MIYYLFLSFSLPLFECELEELSIGIIFIPGRIKSGWKASRDIGLRVVEDAVRGKMDQSEPQIESTHPASLQPSFSHCIHSLITIIIIFIKLLAI